MGPCAIEALPGPAVGQDDEAQPSRGNEGREGLEPGVVTPLPEDIAGRTPAERPAQPPIDCDLLAVYIQMPLMHIPPQVRLKQQRVLSSRCVQAGRAIDLRGTPV